MDHVKETGRNPPKEPVLFSKYASAIVGPDDPIMKPAETSELDYEVELVVVIGKEGKSIPEKDALDYVVGYTVGHDVSARDWQYNRGGGQWMAGKTFDTFSPIGPSIVTNISNPNNLGIRCILNGQTVQQSSTSQFIFKTEQLISYISKIVTLRPGDLIFTGTPPGVGVARKPPLFMKHGDTVTCEIDEIGRLTNKILGSSL